MSWPYFLEMPSISDFSVSSQGTRNSAYDMVLYSYSDDEQIVTRNLPLEVGENGQKQVKVFYKTDSISRSSRPRQPGYIGVDATITSFQLSSWDSQTGTWKTDIDVGDQVIEFDHLWISTDNISNPEKMCAGIHIGTISGTTSDGDTFKYEFNSPVVTQQFPNN